ncbi:MAG: hypothetical protein NT062_14875 [Proteobacteria bacterium]|nr:hypothetical protein [Pseudomonadota bacterium]
MNEHPHDPPLFGTQITREALRAVVTEFYRRVFDDVMIGFMFVGKDRQRLIDKEFEFAANLLGAEGIPYTGRSMRAAHAQHTIFGGHFARRLKVLADVLVDLQVAPEVQRVWLDHTMSLRAQITRDTGSECSSSAAAPPPEPPPTDRPIKLGRR